MQKLILLFIGLTTILVITILNIAGTKPESSLLTVSPTPTRTPTPTPTIILIQLAASKLLENNYHIFQTFNNCGPAALSMALSYYGISETQQKLGQDLRPYQIPNGDNDDKSVTLEELAEKSKEYGFVPYHRPNGNIEQIKFFVTYDIPIIARTWTKINEDIGHYRVIKGFDETAQEIIQDDSLQGKNLRYTYQQFNALWKQFNYEYLVLVPNDKIKIAEQILREDADEKSAWLKALRQAQGILQENPNDATARFNLSVALYNVGEYQRSVEEFEKVEHFLPFRTLWYQIEPILAYYELGNYDRVFEITGKVLNNYNRAFSELYILRGNIYKNQGNIEDARSEFQKAVFYNVNLRSAQEARTSFKTTQQEY
jgi:tetratricopeptide (TPR) repeat protein